MNILISNASGVPIYEQIVRQIKGAILDGQVQEGERCLPSACWLGICAFPSLRPSGPMKNWNAAVL